jgi:hypothetical protein
MSDDRPPYDKPGPERRRVDIGPVDGEERRDATLVLVEKAAEVAAQKVAAIHRRRLVRHTFLAALIAALLITLPTVLIVSHSNNSASIARGKFNCRLWNKGAGVLQDLIQSGVKRRQADAKLLVKYPQITQEYSKIFGPKLVQTFFAEQGGYDTRQETYFATRLLPRIRALADVNCSSAITRGGVSDTETIPTVKPVTVPTPGDG